VSLKKGIEHGKEFRVKPYRRKCWDFCSRVIRFKFKKQMHLDEKLEGL